MSQKSSAPTATESLPTLSISYSAADGITIDTAVQSKQYQNWLAQLDAHKFRVKSVHFQSIDMFGPKVGFIKFKADVVDSSGKFIPGIVFMRGGSVGILPVFICNGKKYAVMTVQPRIATGKFDFLEIPAGMLDGSGNFAGVAAKELEEELAIKMLASDLTDLTALAGCHNGIYLSPGGSDESMRFFSFTRQVTEDEMAAMNGRCTGLMEEGEQITLKIVPLETLLTVGDAKTIVAYALYQTHLAN